MQRLQFDCHDFAMLQAEDRNPTSIMRPQAAQQSEAQHPMSRIVPSSLYEQFQAHQRNCDEVRHGEATNLLCVTT